jgi:hypothetical protein
MRRLETQKNGAYSKKSWLAVLQIIGYRGADSASQVGEIIMAGAASPIRNSFARGGDNLPRNSKTKNAGIKVGESIP